MSTNRYRYTSSENASKARLRTWDWNSSTGACYYTPSVDNPNFVNATIGDFSSITDETHPGFSKRRSKGAIVMGDLEIVKRAHNTDSVLFTVPPTQLWGRMEVEGPLGAVACDKVDRGTGTLSADITRAKSIVMANVYAKMNQSALLSGEFMAEFGQTVSMLRHPFQGSISLLAKMARYRAKNLGKTANSAAQATANAWLEYRYGWTPLFMDMGTIVDKCHESLTSGTQRLVFRSAEMLSRTTSKTQATTVGSAPTLGASVRSTAVCTAAVHGGVLCEVSPHTASDTLMQILGIRPRDVLPTVWERVPYSFVADWFANIGPWLQAVIPAPGVTSVADWVTVVKKTSFNADVDLTYGPVNQYGSVCRASAHDARDETIISRTCLVGPPSTPVLTTRTLSTLQEVDALSLTLQKINTAMKGLRH